MIKKNIFLLFGLSFLMFFLWWRPGLIIGGAESGLPFYHIGNAATSVAHTWTDGLIGLPTSYSVGSYYFFAFLSVFELLHISGSIIQGLLFASVIFISLIFTYFVSKSSLPKGGWWFAVIAAFFYLFNLISIVSVWNRLQYPYILLYAFLPLGFFFFVKGLEERKYIYALLINIGIFLFSIAFTSIPTLQLLWIVFVAYLVFFICTHFHQKRSILFSLLFFALQVIMWGIFNWWWIVPFLSSLSSSSYTSQVAYSSGGDLTTFTGLSDKLGNLVYVFRLMHPDFFASINNIWHGIYGNVFMQIMTFVIPFLAFLPLTFRNKPRYIYFFLGFSLFIILLMQGSSGIFGGIFLFLFSHVRLLEAFRNPFEKFSLLLPFGYAPLISYSCYRIYLVIYRKKGKVFAISTVCSVALSIILIAFPILNRWVFSSSYAPTNNLQIGYYVKVPEYYQEANNWLNKDSSQFRVVAMPLGQEGITYNWLYGYTGVEISNGIFSKPFISFTTSVPFLENINSQLRYSLVNKPQYFSNILSLLNVKYLMTRSDVDYLSRQMENPQTINTFLATASGSLLPSITKAATFGQLTFYTNQKSLPLIYPSISYHTVPSTLPFTDVMSFGNFVQGDILFNQDQNMPGVVLPIQQKTTILTPSTEMVLDDASFPKVSLDDAQKQLFLPHSVPPSISYSLIRLKERIEDSGNTDENSLFFRDLLLSNKRLGELIFQPTEITEKNYLDSVTLLQSFQNSEIENENMYYFRSYLIAEQLLLKDRMSKATSLEKQNLQTALDVLTSFFLKNGVQPQFSSSQQIHDGLSSRTVYDFGIPDEKQFEILLKNDPYVTRDAPFETIKEIQIDNTVKTVTPVRKGDWISFGTLTLPKGNHEIQFYLPNSKNLINNDKDAVFTLTSNTNTSTTRTISLKNMDPAGTYKVSFDYWIEKGNSAKVGLTDNLTVKSNQIYNSFGTNGYDNDFVSKSFSSTVNPSASNHSLIFSVDPYNNCSYVNSKNPILSTQCQNDKAFYNQFSKPTVIQIKNLRVEKLFTNQFVLRNSNPVVPTATNPNVRFIKTNASEYHVTVTNATQPYFLVLSESFNPLWQLKYADTNQVISAHYLVNSYANAWVLDRKGSYTLDLNFVPEKSFVISKIVSGIAIVLSILYVVITFIRKKI